MHPLLVGQERFRPPRVRDMAERTGRVPESDVRRLMKLLGRMGKVDEIAQDHFFLRGTVGKWSTSSSTSRERAERPVHCGAVPRSSRQWAQGRDPDPRIFRSAWCHRATRRFAPHQQASPRPVSARGRCDDRRKTRFRRRIVPGGASGLQIREGPRAGPWWVRLPLSSATFKESAMKPAPSFHLVRRVTEMPKTSGGIRARKGGNVPA